MMFFEEILEELKRERWLPVVEYEGLYEVSDLGRVKSLERKVRNNGGYRTVPEKILIPTAYDNMGHLQLGLHRNNRVKVRQVHRLVLKAFVGPCPPGLQTRHMNGHAWDNHLENLEWNTPSVDAQDKIDHGTISKGEAHGSAILTEEQVRRIYNDDRAHKLIAEEYGISRTSVSNIKYAKGWRHLNLPRQPNKDQNTSGYRGVSWSKSNKKWIAYIRYKGKGSWLGQFDTKEEAAIAFNQAALKFHGKDYAHFNIIPEQTKMAA